LDKVPAGWTAADETDRSGRFLSRALAELANMLRSFAAGGAATVAGAGFSLLSAIEDSCKFP
jgi:hypothetical protein